MRGILWETVTMQCAWSIALAVSTWMSIDVCTHSSASHGVQLDQTTPCTSLQSNSAHFFVVQSAPSQQQVPELTAAGHQASQNCRDRVHLNIFIYLSYSKSLRCRSDTDRVFSCITEIISGSVQALKNCPPAPPVTPSVIGSPIGYAELGAQVCACRACVCACRK